LSDLNSFAVSFIYVNQAAWLILRGVPHARILTHRKTLISLPFAKRLRDWFDGAVVRLIIEPQQLIKTMNDIKVLHLTNGGFTVLDNAIKSLTLCDCTGKSWMHRTAWKWIMSTVTPTTTRDATCGCV